MIRSLHVQNFTVFEDVNLQFGALNIIHGVNGTGKTHLLKLLYALIAASWEEGRKPNAGPPVRSAFQAKIAQKLVTVYRPEALGRLARRRQGHHRRAVVAIEGYKRAWSFKFNFSVQSKSEVTLEKIPAEWVQEAPVYLPTRELLSLYPGFVSLYEGHYLEFDETWRDTCLLLGAPVKRGAKELRIAEILRPLEEAMDGRIELDRNGRFYLVNKAGRMEMPLVAEGLRRLGMLARLIATGALLEHGCLLWDEPEANLNPTLIKTSAYVLRTLALQGVQVFVATHSLFLMRELHVLQATAPKTEHLAYRYFGLQSSPNGVVVQQGPDIADSGDVAALDQELAQADRYIDSEMGASTQSSAAETEA